MKAETGLCLSKKRGSQSQPTRRHTEHRFLDGAKSKQLHSWKIGTLWREKLAASTGREEVIHEGKQASTGHVWLRALCQSRQARLGREGKYSAGNQPRGAAATFSHVSSFYSFPNVAYSVDLPNHNSTAGDETHHLCVNTDGWQAADEMLIVTTNGTISGQWRFWFNGWGKWNRAVATLLHFVLSGSVKHIPNMYVWCN